MGHKVIIRFWWEYKW